MMESYSKYKRAIVFSGGGTRFGIYCGMYAFMADHNIKPDLIIAVCGGSLAATIIARFGNNDDIKAYLQSEELYQFVRSQRLTEQKKLYQLGLFSLRKLADKRSAPIIEDVFNRYLVELPQQLDKVFPQLANIPTDAIATVIIGSEILFSPEEVGNKRNDRKTYRKVVFTDSKTAERIAQNKICINSANYKNSAIDEQLKVVTDATLLTATRISVSDMFYVPPVSYRGTYYAGGAVDLVPIELAHALAEEVIIEKKQKYSPVEEALVRSVLGYSGNERLAGIQQLTHHKGIDTTDASMLLKKHSVSKRIDWKKLEIALDVPKDYKQFVADMEMQWNYGYQRAEEFLMSTKAVML